MNKRIIFFELTPTILNFKIALALKKQGYETMLFSVFDNFDKDFYNQAYSKISSFHINSLSFNINNILNVLYNVLNFNVQNTLFNIIKFKPDIIIGCVAPYPHWIHSIFLYTIKKFCLKIKFVFFPYDVNIIKFKKREYYKQVRVPNFELIAEKYLFENSDGIIFKGGEYEFVKKIYNIKCPVLSFPPYCSSDFVVPINKNKLSKKDRELHFVYIGHVTSNENIEALGMNSFEYPIQQILKQKIHFHVYSPQYKFIKTSKVYNKFLNNEYFHIYPPLGPKKIIKEISKYDFGLNPCDFNFNILKEEFASSGTGNKLSSYLEAGIPCINESYLKKSRSFLSDYNLDFILNESTLFNIKKKYKNQSYYINLNKNLYNLRKNFTVENNLIFLVKFLNNLC